MDGSEDRRAGSTCALLADGDIEIVAQPARIRRAVALPGDRAGDDEQVADGNLNS